MTSTALVLITMWLPQPNEVRRPLLVATALVGLVVGLITPQLPWHRWPDRAILGLVVIGFALLGVGNYALGGVPHLYTVNYTIVFAFIGLTQPPGTSILALPVALFSYLIPGLAPDTHGSVTGAIVAAPAWVLIAEVLARSTARTLRAEQGAGRLLEASSALARANRETEAAELIAAWTVDLLNADSSVVLLPNREGDELVNLGQSNFDLPIGEIRLDLTTVSNFGSRGPLRVSDVMAARMPDIVKQHINAQSVLCVPLGTETVFDGLVIAGWRNRRSRLDHYSRRAAQFLASEATGTVERLQAARTLELRAETDELTQLANRRIFARALDAVRPGDAVALIDLDHFKNVNDKYGHGYGDDVLRKLADCMRRAARRSDCAARYGGEEFALVLSESGERGALAAVRRLRGFWEETDPPTTFSAGIAVHTENDVPTTTLARADAALYKAKAAGRNRIEIAAAPDVPVV